MSAPVSHFNLPFQKRQPGGDDEPTPPADPSVGSLRRLLDTLKDAGIRWSDGDSLRLASSQSYVMLLALFPLLIVLLSVTHMLLRDSETVRTYLLGFVDASNSPLIRDAIIEGLEGAQKTSG
ncbi:MAG: hypothetical protein EOO70_06065, partial [Myxococcaceae bacterium]